MDCSVLLWFAIDSISQFILYFFPFLLPALFSNLCLFSRWLTAVFPPLPPDAVASAASPPAANRLSGAPSNHRRRGLSDGHPRLRHSTPVRPQHLLSKCCLVQRRFAPFQWDETREFFSNRRRSLQTPTQNRHRLWERCVPCPSWPWWCSSGCSGQCSDSEPCGKGQACVDNQCCACSKEDFTLVLKNLTFEDSGRYKCQIANQSELLEFQVEVLGKQYRLEEEWPVAFAESGLRGGFHENISYDYSSCCLEKGISPLCRAMCKPSEMGEHHFDPTRWGKNEWSKRGNYNFSCKTDDYKNFLTCATQNNTRNHVHCCKTQLVPSFCYDFCSGDFQVGEKR